MTQQSARESGLPNTSYYAPNFRVRVEGEELDPESKGDIVQLRVSLGIEELASCELTINNWDDRRFEFKYSDIDTFDVGRRVQVEIGYADELVSVFTGQVTRFAPKFPDSGAPTMTVTCLDGLVKLRDRQPADGESRKYEGLADWQIAQQVAERHGLDFEGTQEGAVHPIVWQKNQDDASFLMERASRIDFDCYVLTDAESGRDKLYFVRPTDGRSAHRTQVYVLEYQKSLSSFTPEIDVSSQVGSVTVRGWNPRTKEMISYTATRQDLPPTEGSGTTGPQVAEERMGNKPAQVVDAPVSSEEEARELAISILRSRAYEFIQGEGQIIGLPRLGPGDNLDVLGIGKRFSGVYYVKKVDHAIGENGFLTTFKVRRYFDGGLS